MVRSYQLSAISFTPPGSDHELKAEKLTAKSYFTL
jgi:hypothetical protein